MLSLYRRDQTSCTLLQESEVYELYQTPDRQVLRIVPDSPEWFSWLEQVSSFAFVGKRGNYIARKEVKRWGDRYWSTARLPAASC
jgi:hypothetical protein